LGSNSSSSSSSSSTSNEDILESIYGDEKEEEEEENRHYYHDDGHDINHRKAAAAVSSSSSTPSALRRISDSSSSSSSSTSSGKRNPLVKEGKGGEEERKKFPHLMLAALLLVFVSNQWSRALIYYINNFNPQMNLPLDEAKRLYANIDLGYDSTAYSWLASFGFTGTFAIASIFAGRIADSYNRGLVVSVAAVIWSIFLGMGSLSGDFSHLFASRSAMGLAQAVTTPSSYTLLAEITPKEKIAYANSVGIIESIVLLTNLKHAYKLCMCDGCPHYYYMQTVYV